MEDKLIFWAFFWLDQKSNTLKRMKCENQKKSKQRIWIKEHFSHYILVPLSIGFTYAVRVFAL